MQLLCTKRAATNNNVHRPRAHTECKLGPMANVVAEGRAVEVVELPRYRKPKRGQEEHDKEAIAVAKRHGIPSYNEHSKEL